MKGIYCYRDTRVGGSRIIGQEIIFFSPFLHAYNHHGDILLFPYAIWILISLFLSKYIDANAQKTEELVSQAQKTRRH